MNMENNFTLWDTSIRVRYEETDQMGVVYYGNYFTWFEIGRTELFRSIGLPYTAFEAQGIMLPVAEADCKYKMSARYDDLVTIRTCISTLTPARIQFGYIIMNEAGEMIAKGHTMHAFMDETGRPVNLSKKNPDLWHKIGELVKTEG